MAKVYCWINGKHMMKKVFTIVCVILFFNGVASGEDISENEQEDLNKRLHNVYEKIQKSVVVVQRMRETITENNGEVKSVWAPTKFGTGFILKIDKAVLVITAEHIVRNLQNNERIKIVAKDVDNKTRNNDDCKIFVSDSESDVAVIIFSDEIDKFDSTMIYKGTINNLTEYFKTGVNIIYAGFPYKRGEHYIYVFQKGMIAGRDRYKLKTGESVYILQGEANPGNSGSPVFLEDGSVVVGMILEQVEPLTPYSLAVLNSKNNILQKSTKSSGLSIALPINHVIKLIQDKVIELQDQISARIDKLKSWKKWS